MDAMNTMTLRDISELLKISEQTARTRVRNGKPMPPSFKAGQRRLFLTSEVQKWLLTQTSASSCREGLCSSTCSAINQESSVPLPLKVPASVEALMT